MKPVLLTVEQTAEKIASGMVLSLAADEALLARLQKGNWIAGTIPYFLGEDGGVETKDKIFVTELSAANASNVAICTYTLDTIKNVARDAPENGFTVLIVPAMTPIHEEFANHGRDYEDMFMKPIIGWISGVHLSDLDKVKPKVMNGVTGRLADADAVALHVTLPAGKVAVVQILNLFKQGTGDVITFPKTGFNQTTCMVNGAERVFADYIAENQLDLKLPLVADYHGAQINTSFQGVDAATRQVNFYAPVFPGIEYRHAAPIGDYAREFEKLAKEAHVDVQFSCNCILNYLYGELNGRKIGGVGGPFTFGEIAYQLLNQTMVYLEVQSE